MTDDDKKNAKEITDDALEEVQGGIIGKFKPINTRLSPADMGETPPISVSYTLDDVSETIQTATIDVMGTGINTKKR